MDRKAKLLLWAPFFLAVFLFFLTVLACVLFILDVARLTDDSSGTVVNASWRGLAISSTVVVLTAFLIVWFWPSLRPV